MTIAASALHAELARVVLADRDLTEVLTEVVGIARRAIPGAEATSITLIRTERPFTVAFDGGLARAADELQYQQGHGPCLDAARTGSAFVVDDMTTEDRWPDYASRAVEAGVRSSMSIPLPFQGATIGGLNNYATRPGAFGPDAQLLGEEVAAFVAVVVGNAEAAARATQDAANMRRAMESRAVIEQAKGILMERYKVTVDQAFLLLTRASQQRNVKLREVAEELVRTGVLRGG